MTTSKTQEVKRRLRKHGFSPSGGLIGVCDRLLEIGAGARWPNPIYAPSPTRFAHEILGVELAPKQVEIIEAIRDHKRVAVRGGRKVGKDFAVAVSAP